MSRRAFCVALAIAVLRLAAPDPAAATADTGVETLLSKHRAFVGWQLGDGAFRTIRLTRVRSGGEGQVTQRGTEYRIGIVYRNRYVFPNGPIPSKKRALPEISFGAPTKMALRRRCTGRAQCLGLLGGQFPGRAS